MQRITLIFLHGGPGFKDYLSPYFEEFKNYFTTVFYDQLQGSEVKMSDLISQLDEIVSTQTGKIILVGHSWGGVLAAEYALRFEKKISGLVLMCTGLNHKHWYDDFHAEKERLGLNDAPPAEIFLTADEREEGSVFLDKTWETFSGETFDSLEESYIRQFDLTPSLPTLSIPILNIFGEKDVRFPSKVAKTLNGVEIAGAGHFPFLRESGRRQILTALRAFKAD